MSVKLREDLTTVRLGKTEARRSRTVIGPPIGIAIRSRLRSLASILRCRQCQD